MKRRVVTMFDNTKIKMTGAIKDEIYKDGVLIDTIVGHNLVVNSFTKLVMGMLKGDINSGIKYWAIGSGSADWDSDMPEPEINASRLTNEIGRVAIASEDITYLLPDGTESESPTNILQIKHTFGADDCNGEWREFGIFGGDAATDELNTGIIIDKKHHELKAKTSDIVITRTLVFTLTLS